MIKKLLKSGSLWGLFTTLAGAMMGPPVLAVLDTKTAGTVIVIGSIVTALSKSLPALIEEISNDTLAKHQ